MKKTDNLKQQEVKLALSQSYNSTTEVLGDIPVPFLVKDEK
jgi:hypothetical protein